LALDRATSRRPRVPGHPALTAKGPIRQLWEEFNQLGPYEPHVIDNSTLDLEQTPVAIHARFLPGSDRLAFSGKSGSSL